jgi:hypothetical protein
MVKDTRAIEFIDDYRDRGEGQGGCGEDCEYFGQEAAV